MYKSITEMHPEFTYQQRLELIGILAKTHIFIDKPITFLN